MIYLDCYRCKNILPETKFTTDNRRYYRNNKHLVCRDCRNFRDRENAYKASNDTLIRKILNNRLKSSKYRSKKENTTFDLDLDYLVSLYYNQKGLCAISKIPMTFNIYNGKNSLNISLDKIDPKKGYIKDNVQLLCFYVNQMKSDLNLNELVYFCKQIVENNENKNN